MVALISATFSAKLSTWVTGVGNLPALERPGPNKRGICLIKASEAKKASYFFAMVAMLKGLNSLLRACAWAHVLPSEPTKLLDELLVLV